ncbi:hypothetical protein BJ958_002786 [Nocardioides kongjuensis]|uniref:DNA-binding protein n=1 Tax=Nocardioides kongjuensis TaxID=349522 RepID=A0A852RQW2_9ACTN|nr:hypothetical protein [Nocardioides kongjuensis]
MADHEHDLVTSCDAADLIGLRYQAFRKRMERDTLPFRPVTKLGGSWLWRRTDVEAYARLQDT